MPSRLSIHLDEMFWMPKLSSFFKKKIFFLHIWNIPSLHSSKLWERLKSDQLVLLYGLEIVQRNAGQTICSLGFAPLLPPPLWFPPSWMLLGKWSGTWHFLFLKWTKTSDGRTNPPVSCSSSFCSVEEGLGGTRCMSLISMDRAQTPKASLKMFLWCRNLKGGWYSPLPSYEGGRVWFH